MKGVKSNVHKLHDKKSSCFEFIWSLANGCQDSSEWLHKNG
ncbi:MAG: hypothetical protein PWP56_422 [Acetobacterium sp.]|nr:hypothetical protein [Acetobacterium sp.]